jgi:hypothetical protein
MSRTENPNPAPARAPRPTRRPGTAMPAVARVAPVAGTTPGPAAASMIRRAALARLPLLRPLW